MRGGIMGAAAGVIGMLATAGPAVAQSNGTQPAGGAALGEAIGATAGALVATALVVLLISRHRGGRTDVLNRFGDWAERQTGLPAWASVPSMLLSVSLSSPCSACTGHLARTSTTGAIRARWPTRPTI